MMHRITNFYQFLSTIAMCVMLCLATAVVAPAQSFVHPGIWHKASDLDRMKYMVQAGQDPWKASFDLMVADPKASYNYAVRGQNYTAISREPTCDHCRDFEEDVRAAYLNALMWYITGDQRHADKAIACLNAWNSLRRFYGGGTEPLSAGLYASLLVNAAEIIKNTNAGWAPADVDKFKAMLVYPGYSATVAPSAAISSKDVTFYWSCYRGDPFRHGNQDLLPMKAVVEMGIFLDNRVMYERGLRYFKGLPHRPDDLPYASGPGSPGSLLSKTSYVNSYRPINNNTTPDYGFNGVITNYIWENGQCQESSRDQSHAMLGLGNLAELAEIAWNQGDDTYGLAGKRIRKGLEYTARYNVSYRNTYADQPTPWEPTAPNDFFKRFDRTGRWQSKRINPFYDNDTARVARGQYQTHTMWELPLAHYQGRLGMPTDSVKWTQRARDRFIAEVGYEQSGYRTDDAGWGGLTFRRANLCPGDPCSFIADRPVYKINVLPGTVEAENFDYFLLGGQGKTYNDLSTNNTGGKYRLSDGVDVETCTEGGYDVTDIQPGEWLSYTVAVPVAGTYTIGIRYAATNSNGKIRFEFDGVDKTGDITVPFSGIILTGSRSWKDFTVKASVALRAGVQRMRILSSGSGNAYQLNKITVAPLGSQTLTAATISADQQLALFPNPASRSVTLTLPSSLSQQIVNASLLNSLGQTVLRRTLPATANVHTLSVVGLPPGVYSLRLQANNTVVNKSLVIQ